MRGADKWRGLLSRFILRGMMRVVFAVMRRMRRSRILFCEEEAGLMIGGLRSCFRPRLYLLEGKGYGWELEVCAFDSDQDVIGSIILPTIVSEIAWYLPFILREAIDHIDGGFPAR